VPGPYYFNATANKFPMQSGTPVLITQAEFETCCCCDDCTPCQDCTYDTTGPAATVTISGCEGCILNEDTDGVFTMRAKCKHYDDAGNGCPGYLWEWERWLDEGHTVRVYLTIVYFCSSGHWTALIWNPDTSEPLFGCENGDIRTVIDDDVECVDGVLTGAFTLEGCPDTDCEGCTVSVTL
jgi:hypothetical protein